MGGELVSALGEYAVKAVAAGTTLVKLLKFLETGEQTIELTRAEVEAIIMTIREQATELKLRKIKERQR
jgi:hypothetical protein